jgi:hypothetical protein
MLGRFLHVNGVSWNPPSPTITPAPNRHGCCPGISGCARQAKILAGLSPALAHICFSAARNACLTQLPLTEPIPGTATYIMDAPQRSDRIAIPFLIPLRHDPLSLYMAAGMLPLPRRGRYRRGSRPRDCGWRVWQEAHRVSLGNLRKRPDLRPGYSSMTVFSIGDPLMSEL